MGITQLNKGSVSTDSARLDNVLAAMLAFTPAVGQYQAPQGLLSYATSAPVRQRMSFYPFMVGPSGWTVDALQFNVTTAAVGGTSPKLLVGIYPDDGTGFPDCSAGPLASVTGGLTTLTLAKQTATLAAALVLKPGTLYWVCTIYDYSVVPTTAPQFSCNANSTWQFGVASSLTFNPNRGYVSSASTFTALPTSAIASSNMVISGTTDVPIGAFHRSA